MSNGEVEVVVRGQKSLIALEVGSKLGVLHQERSGHYKVHKGPVRFDESHASATEQRYVHAVLNFAGWRKSKKQAPVNPMIAEHFAACQLAQSRHE